MKTFLRSAKEWSSIHSYESRWIAGVHDKLGLLAALALVIVIFSFLSPVFFSGANFSIILRQNSILFILAAATTIVIIGGGIDLSIGSNMIFSSIIVALTLRHFGASGIALAIAAGLLSGLLVGLANGLMVGRFGINPWLVTLATLALVRGLAYVISQGQLISGVPRELSAFITGTFGPFSMNIWIAVLVGIVLLIILSYTAVGYAIRGIGSNSSAASYVGIPLNKYYLLIYGLSGILASVAGIILVGNVSSTAAYTHAGIELDAIAGVVVGGTSFSGGIGSIGGTILGVLIIGVIQNGLTILGASTHYLKLFRGLILVIVVMIGSLRERHG